MMQELLTITFFAFIFHKCQEQKQGFMESVLIALIGALFATTLITTLLNQLAQGLAQIPWEAIILLPILAGGLWLYRRWKARQP